MISLGTQFITQTCPECKIKSTMMVTTEIVDYGTHLRKVVADCCPKCGKKLSKEQGFVRDLTDDEVNELYTSKGKLK